MAFSKVEPWDLMVQGKYSEALRQYGELLKENPNDPGTLWEHAIALLCLSRSPRKALEEFRRSNELERQDSSKVHRKSQPYLGEIGTMLWLLSKRKEALLTFRSGAEGMLSGEIQFGDLAGGASHGLLLWYAGVTLGDNEAITFAQNYLQKLVKPNSMEFFPGPLVLLVLGKTKPKDVLAAVCGTNDLKKAISLASSDLLMRRELVRSIFYFAVQERAAGREQQCVAKMRECIAIENPVLEVEWYLARGEVEQADRNRKQNNSK